MSETKNKTAMEVVWYVTAGARDMSHVLRGDSIRAGVSPLALLRMVLREIRDRAGRGETTRSLEPTITGEKTKRKGKTVEDEEVLLRKLRSQGFRDGYLARDRRHSWSSDYCQGYDKGMRSGRCQEGEEQALYMEANYRGTTVARMSEYEILEFSNQYWVFLQARIKDGVDG